MANEMIERCDIAAGATINRLGKAVTAMREPTGKMRQAYGEFGTLDIDAYHAMIDCILND